MIIHVNTVSSFTVGKILFNIGKGSAFYFCQYFTLRFEIENHNYIQHTKPWFTKIISLRYLSYKFSFLFSPSRFYPTNSWLPLVPVNTGNTRTQNTRTHSFLTSLITRMPSVTRYRWGTESWPLGSLRGRGFAPGSSLRGRRNDKWMVRENIP